MGAEWVVIASVRALRVPLEEAGGIWAWAGALECSPLHCCCRRCCCCCVGQSSRPEVRHGVGEVRGPTFLRRMSSGLGTSTCML